MKTPDHIAKAQRIESSISGLDGERDWELIVEGIYGICLHYIAAICEIKLKEHRDTHKGLIAFLKEKGMYDVANGFQRLDELRQGRWYGNKTNGNTVSLAREVLTMIKKNYENETR